MLSKEEAIKLLHEHVKKEANLEHCYFVGDGMLGIAKYLKKNEEEQQHWFIVGLLHDLDIEMFGDEMEKHTLITEKILQEKNISQKIIDDIKSHNEHVVKERKNELQHALYSVDGLTGIIRAYVLMRPDKDINQAKTSSIMKKIKDKLFAASVNREQIYLCEKTLNIPLNVFVENVLKEIKEK